MNLAVDFERRRAFTNGTASASLVALITAVATGDWLLWTNYPVLSLALFLAGLAGLQAALSWQQLDRQRLLYAGNLLMLGLAPLLETLNTLSVIIAVSGTFAACLILRSEVWLTILTRWPERLDAFVTAVLMSVPRFAMAVYAGLNRADLSGASTALRGWFWPALFAGVFVLLFVVASPVWENWFHAIDMWAVFAAVFSPRALFWLGLAWFCWPFIERSAPVVQGFRWAKFGFDLLKLKNTTIQTSRSLSIAFFERSLILFNVVFAAQTLLDISYLWGGVSLPEGMTYAEYAHRGAYPLVAAALLAASFVVIAMRPGGPGERSVLVKWLVLGWVAQNVMLVASSILRLDLYIAAYALTYWRVAAFVWMGLVATGLLLIVARFVLNRTTGWLITANLTALATVLYAASFVNFPNVIARYNLEHSSIVMAGGSRMDYVYLRHLGPHALPALMYFMTQNPAVSGDQKSNLEQTAQMMVHRAERDIGDGWRSWSWRKHRLRHAMKSSELTAISSVSEMISHWPTPVSRWPTPVSHGSAPVSHRSGPAMSSRETVQPELSAIFGTPR